jgi:hypothetical protein
MKFMSFVLFVLLLPSLVPAQQMWTRTYGGANDDYGYSVQPTSDGGYIIAGSTCSRADSSNGDVYLIKTNASGDTLWTGAYGGSGTNVGYSVQQTTDGGYIIAGATNPYDSIWNYVYLVKTDAWGESLWARTYGGTGDNEGYSVQQTTDGGYIIAGATNSFGAGDYDVYLIKTDGLGDTLWTRTYGGTGDDEGYCVEQTTDGGYIVAGATTSFGAVVEDVYLIKTNASGDTIWTRAFGGRSDDKGYSVQQTTDGGYIIAGYTNSLGARWYDVNLIKTNGAGDTLWSSAYGGDGTDEGYSVRQTSDGGYIIAGETNSFGAGGYDAYLIRTNASGATLWIRTYGGDSTDYANSVQQTSDGGYIIAGSTNSFGGGGYDVYLIKTDDSGYVGLKKDVACTGVKQPGSGVPAGRPIIPILTIMNKGVHRQTNIPVGLWIDSTGVRVYACRGTLAGPLLPESTVQCTLTTPWTPGGGVLINYNLTAFCSLLGDQYRGDDTVKGLVTTCTWIDDLRQDSGGLRADRGWQFGLPESLEVRCWGDPLVDTTCRTADDTLRIDRLVATLDTPKIAWGSWYFTYPGLPDAGYRLRYSTDDGETWTLAHASLPGGRGYDGVVGADSAYWGQCPGDSWERMLYEIPVAKGATFSFCWEYVDLLGSFYPGVLIDYIEGFGFPQPASVMEGKTFPAAFDLSIAPNPFHCATIVSYSLPQAGNVSVKLYDIAGALVRTLAEGRCTAGAHAAEVNAAKLGRGVYILKFAGGGRQATAKLVIE